MTEKNSFAYKLFLSLNTSDFNFFFMWQLQLPLKKVTPSKSWGLVKPPPLFEKIGWRLIPPAEKGECTLCCRANLVDKNMCSGRTNRAFVKISVTLQFLLLCSGLCFWNCYFKVININKPMLFIFFWMSWILLFHLLF